MFKNRITKSSGIDLEPTSHEHVQLHHCYFAPITEFIYARDKLRNGQNF